MEDANGVIAESAMGNPYLFTSRRWEKETGLYHYRARAYSPYLGRFLQTDPLKLVNEPNYYTYAYNNPGRYIDPTGEISLLIPALVVIAVGVVVGITAVAVMKRIKKIDKLRIENLEKGSQDPVVQREIRRTEGEIEVITGLGVETKEAIERATNPIGTLVEDIGTSGEEDIGVELIERGLDKIGVPRNENPNEGSDNVLIDEKCPKQ